MYLRTTTRRAADGTLVRYLQLAHTEWDPAAHRSKVRVLVIALLAAARKTRSRRLSTSGRRSGSI
jgi:hypothetical protein